ncbi:homolog to virus protein HRPV1-VP8 [Natronomonas pharaonis DSM 2160]|uniref:Homolog to virus protein HRPV1-VP8 n=1 Tax=Natronomonas pharaonis (strain ATCC 35678 / DSM 2160 / CIP 103997 / JCM 8858 / NBRC 14720 / NCIMB 2260 / Gabara) TaxID=348780 RepID=A0A1U7EW17_NATPD|nr:hypothetical protein [Natronomonas pharaonis]CAI49265.1 homolog to virus protein HRPV1-VP8 [Natronomonas pharaonis DSM 2160]
MSNSGYQAAELSDKIRDGDVGAHIDSVLADDQDMGHVMLMMEKAGVDDGPLAEMLSRKGQTDMLRKARQNGDVASMNAATGLSESRVDATGYEMLLSRIEPAAQQALIKGPKGSGKTTKALDIARRLYTRFEGELSIATNIKGPDEHDDVQLVESVSEMLEWNRDTDGEKLMIGDEWSTTVNAHAGGGDARKTFSQFINALRKGRGGSTRLLVIGHEHDTDIAKILRTQSDVVIRADGKVDEGLIACATVYDGWTDYVEDDHAFQLRGLQDVPENGPWGTDTNYFAHFELDLDEPDKQIRKGKLIDDWEAYQDDATNDGDDELDPLPCRGIKDDGTDCGAITKHESGFCAHHRDQWTGDDDPRRQDE